MTRNDGDGLNRPIWLSLETRLADLAVGNGQACRFRPDINLLGAAADMSAEALTALADLVPEGETLGIFEGDDWPTPPGLEIVKQAELLQMVLSELSPEKADKGRNIDWVPLTESDAGAMYDLATLTQPGPFVPNSYLMGGFVGVKQDGQLIAMAGERMKLPGYCEVSGVCTHPDHRGRGYAGALMRVVIDQILTRGEKAFLHSYASNAGAIGLYESLGFQARRTVTYTIYKR